MSKSMTIAARQGRRLAAAVIIVAAATCILGPPSLARAAATAPAKVIRQVACKPWTFNVYYGSKHEKCYAGHGTKVVRIPNVHVVTTGDNRGSFTYTQRNGEGRIAFVPRERLGFAAGRHVELVTLTIV